MSFTYSDGLTLPRDVIRLNIGDTVTGEGPRPDGRNFSDEELSYLVTEEDDNTSAGVARVFEILAAEWTQYAMSEKEADLSFDAKGVADKYEDLAEKWWHKSGRRTTGVTPGFSEHQIIFHLGYGNT